MEIHNNNPGLAWKGNTRGVEGQNRTTSTICLVRWMKVPIPNAQLVGCKTKLLRLGLRINPGIDKLCINS